MGYGSVGRISMGQVLNFALLVVILAPFALLRALLEAIFNRNCDGR